MLTVFIARLPRHRCACNYHFSPRGSKSKSRYGFINIDRILRAFPYTLAQNTREIDTEPCLLRPPPSPSGNFNNVVQQGTSVASECCSREKRRKGKRGRGYVKKGNDARRITPLLLPPPPSRLCLIYLKR